MSYSVIFKRARGKRLQLEGSPIILYRSEVPKPIREAGKMTLVG